MFAAATDPWRWQPHPEVWMLVAAVVVLGVAAVRVIGPKVVDPGAPVVTKRQKRWFVAAVGLMWLASDWPMHDVGEEYLYLVHMIQHLLLTFVVPPLFLMAMPTWLARLLVGDGWFAGRAVRWLTKPVVAGLGFNVMVAISHWPAVVNQSIDFAPLHYSIHVLLVTTALLMWLPVCGPLPELRMSLPQQMVYLFLMSVLPTIPAAWLTFAEGAVYHVYDRPYRLWGISVRSDQQAAGLIMKLIGGGYLWVLIAVLFFKWAARHEEAERKGRLVSEHDVLTWDKVKAELDELEAKR